MINGELSPEFQNPMAPLMIEISGQLIWLGLFIYLNFDSVYHGVQAALPVMMRQRSGTFVTTTSGAGLAAVRGHAVYGAAKAGLISLMRSVAVEYGPYGIRANTISPGPMDTPGLRAALNTTPKGIAHFASQIPVGRLGTAEDIAAAAVFLASDEASFISGIVLPVDGAILAAMAASTTDCRTYATALDVDPERGEEMTDSSMPTMAHGWPRKPTGAMSIAITIAC